MSQAAPSADAPAAQPSSLAGGGEQLSAQRTYPMAPLIRATLLLLYLALVLPLPFLAPPGLRLALALAVPFGLAIVLAISSEQVDLDASGIRVGHPRWCSWWLRRGWSLDWSEISSLTAVATSQGGRVFYVRDRQGGAYLLPQRVDRFAQFLSAFARHSGLDLASVQRISPPWTYQLLAVLSGLMLAGEAVVLMRQL